MLGSYPNSHTEYICCNPVRRLAIALNLPTEQLGLVRTWIPSNREHRVVLFLPCIYMAYCLFLFHYLSRPNNRLWHYCLIYVPVAIFFSNTAIRSFVPGWSLKIAGGEGSFSNFFKKPTRPAELYPAFSKYFCPLASALNSS